MCPPPVCPAWEIFLPGRQLVKYTNAIRRGRSSALDWCGWEYLHRRSGEVGDAAERTELAVPACNAQPCHGSCLTGHPAELYAEKSSPPPQLRVIAGRRMLRVCSCHRAASLQAPLAAAAAPRRFFSVHPGSSDGLQAGYAAAGRARGRGKANRALSVKVFFPCFCVSCPSSAASLREVACVLGAPGREKVAACRDGGSWRWWERWEEDGCPSQEDAALGGRAAPYGSPKCVTAPSLVPPEAGQDPKMFLRVVFSR